jgi:hypothetical protein
MAVLLYFCIEELSMRKPPKAKKDSHLLVGWQQIATFLGVPMSTAHRWAKSGMPTRREGRSVVASVEELNGWLGREVAGPVHISTADTDLGAELKRGLAFVKKGRQ